MRDFDVILGSITGAAAPPRIEIRGYQGLSFQDRGDVCIELLRPVRDGHF